MPNVDTTVWINAPLAKVYEIAKDNRSFPEYMKDVQSINIIEQGSDGRVVSDWVGIISMFNVKVRWQQEDLWDDVAHTCRFRQLKGDYDMMEGVWTFLEEDGGTRLNINMEYEYNIPTLGPLVKKVVLHLVIKNLESFNDALKARAESA